jgi:hypothetical protein
MSQQDENTRPSAWGPHMWYAIHFVCLGYPRAPSEEDRRNYKAFFLALPDVLPCLKCAKHLQDNLLKLPLDAAALAGDGSLFAWSVRLHNLVNADLGKEPWEVEDARKYYASYNTMSGAAVAPGAAPPDPPSAGASGLRLAAGLLAVALLVACLVLLARRLT